MRIEELDDFKYASTLAIKNGIRLTAITTISRSTSITNFEVKKSTVKEGLKMMVSTYFLTEAIEIFNQLCETEEE